MDKNIFENKELIYERLKIDKVSDEAIKLNKRRVLARVKYEDTPFKLNEMFEGGRGFRGVIIESDTTKESVNYLMDAYSAYSYLQNSIDSKDYGITIEEMIGKSQLMRLTGLKNTEEAVVDILKGLIDYLINATFMRTPITHRDLMKKSDEVIEFLSNGKFRNENDGDFTDYPRFRRKVNYYTLVRDYDVTEKTRYYLERIIFSKYILLWIHVSSQPTPYLTQEIENGSIHRIREIFKELIEMDGKEIMDYTDQSFRETEELLSKDNSSERGYDTEEQCRRCKNGADYDSSLLALKYEMVTTTPIELREFPNTLTNKTAYETFEDEDGKIDIYPDDFYNLLYDMYLLGIHNSLVYGVDDGISLESISGKQTREVNSLLLDKIETIVNLDTPTNHDEIIKLTVDRIIGKHYKHIYLYEDIIELERLVTMKFGEVAGRYFRERVEMINK